MPTCAIVSFRLGMTDGVSVVAESWRDALEDLGLATYTVAGEGVADHLLAGLAIGSAEPPSERELSNVLASADVVVVENALTIPLNLGASRALARVLRGRRAVLHHHDPPWQRTEFARVTELPADDATWLHVTVSELTRSEMAARGLASTLIRNGFETEPATADGTAMRRSLDVDDGEVLLVHPVRAIERKNVAGAIRFCEALGATYWLTGPAEDGYDEELARLLGAARCRTIHRGGFGRDELYPAADAVLFPSHWEGFGNPPVEAAVYRKPAVVGRYPVSEELRALGFEWFDPAEPEALAAFLASPSGPLLDQNLEVVRAHLSREKMAEEIAGLLAGAGGLG